jgi:hypothetical protein
MMRQYANSYLLGWFLFFKMKSNKCWQEWEIGTVKHCRLKCEMVKLLWKTKTKTNKQTKNKTLVIELVMVA